MHLEDLAGFRQVAYRLFSSILLYPEEERLKTIATAAMKLQEQSHALVKFAYFLPQWKRLLVTLADLPTPSVLEEEYIRVFMHGSERVPCLPYESVYMDPGGQAAGWILAMLEQEYAAAGLALSPSQKELPDHVAVELEFMAFLCGQEADAWNREVVKDAVEVLERQAAFLDRHLTRWFPEWARQVTNADGEGIYSVTAETVGAFVSHDRDLVGSLLGRFWGIPEATQARVKSKVAAKKQPRSGRYRHRL